MTVRFYGYDFFLIYTSLAGHACPRRCRYVIIVEMMALGLLGWGVFRSSLLAPSVCHHLRSNTVQDAYSERKTAHVSCKTEASILIV